MKNNRSEIGWSQDFDEYQEAKDLGLNTRPVVVGPFTFLQLSDFEDGVKAEDFVDSLAAAYQEVFANWQSLVRLVSNSMSQLLSKICQLKKSPLLEPLQQTLGGQERP